MRWNPLKGRSPAEVFDVLLDVAVCVFTLALGAITLFIGWPL